MLGDGETFTPAAGCRRYDPEETVTAAENEERSTSAVWPQSWFSSEPVALESTGAQSTGARSAPVSLNVDANRREPPDPLDVRTLRVRVGGTGSRDGRGHGLRSDRDE